MKRKSHNSSNSSGEVGFGLGFFAGAVIGSLGIYLFATPEGRQIKQSLKKEFEQHREKYLENLLVIDLEIPEPTDQKLSYFRAFLTNLREKISTKKAKIIIKNTIIDQKNKKKHYFKKK